MRISLAALWSVVAVPSLLFIETLAYGGDRIEVALVFALLFTAGLAVLLWADSKVTSVLSGRALRPLWWLFGGLSAYILLQLGPWPTGMSREGWAAVSGPPAATMDKFATVAELVKLWGLGAVFLTGMVMAANPVRARWCVIFTGALGAAYVAGAIVKFFAYDVRVDDGPTPRLAGSLLNANNTSAFLAIIAVLAAACVMRALGSINSRRSVAQRSARILAAVGPWALIIIAASWGAALTGSRGGAICALAGLSAVAAASAWSSPGGASNSRARQVLVWAVLLIPMAAAALLYGTGNVGERLRIAPDGVVNRQGILDLYTARVQYVPPQGFGLGSFRRFNNTILGGADTDMLWQFGAMHNVYLQWIYEAGWLGAGLMFSCIGWILAVITIALIRARAGQTWTVAAIGVSVLLLTHGMIDFDLQIPAIAGVWAFFLGAAFSQTRPDSLAVTPTRRVVAEPAGRPTALKGQLSGLVSGQNPRRRADKEQSIPAARDPAD